MNENDRALAPGVALAVRAIGELGTIARREALDRGQPGEIDRLERVTPAERGQSTGPTERDRCGETADNEEDQSRTPERESLHVTRSSHVRDPAPKPQHTRRCSRRAPGRACGGR